MPRVFINVESPDDVVHCGGRGGDLVRHDLLLFPFVLSLLPSLMLVWVRRDIRRPQALHNVLAPSGPRRHSGVCSMEQLRHFPGGAARFRQSVNVPKGIIHFAFYIWIFHFPIVRTNTFPLAIQDLVGRVDVLKLGNVDRDH